MKKNMNIRIDEDAKKGLSKFCDEVGISVSAAFNMFAKYVVRNQRFPFDITTDAEVEKR